MKDRTCLQGFVALILIGLLTMVGCSTYQQHRRNPECRELFDLIGHGWKRDSANGLYVLSAQAQAGNRFGHFHDDECLIGLAGKDVQRLFGKPDKVLEDGTMEYYRTQPCLEGGTKVNGCHFMAIRFDAQGGLKSILFGSTMVDYD